MEEALAGGYTNSVHRVEETVRRQLQPNSAFVHALLRFFEEQGVSDAPRFLGVDDQGREIVSYIEGYCPHKRAGQPAGTWSDGSLTKAFQMLRKFHDVTAGSELAGDQEVVLYGDPAPRNTIYRNGTPIAFIDWDLARPGPRVHDVAQGVWQWLDLGAPDYCDLAENQRLIRMLAKAYGLTSPELLIDEIIAVQTEVVEDLRRQLTGDAPAVHRELEKAMASVIRERSWVMENKADLASALH